MDTLNTYAINFQEEDTILLPSFTCTHTLSGPRREPVWVLAREAVAALRQKGISTTTQTLFNKERRKELRTYRIGKKNVKFDLLEVYKKFKVQQ